MVMLLSAWENSNLRQLLIVVSHTVNFPDFIIALTFLSPTRIFVSETRCFLADGFIFCALKYVTPNVPPKNSMPSLA
jgi:hypothetical protein